MFNSHYSFGFNSYFKQAKIRVTAVFFKGKKLNKIRIFHTLDNNVGYMFTFSFSHLSRADFLLFDSFPHIYIVFILFLDICMFCHKRPNSLSPFAYISFNQPHTAFVNILIKKIPIPI